MNKSAIENVKNHLMYQMNICEKAEKRRKMKA